MGTDDFFDVVIIGGGPAGLTAALYLARADYNVVVVEKEKFGGQITITEEIVNYPGVISTSGEKLTSQMKRQAENFGAKFLKSEVTGIEPDGNIKKVKMADKEIKCIGIILATGANPRKLGFKGEDKFQGRGVAYCATCDGEFFRDREIFVIGGGYAAAEQSVFLTKYARHVTILIREEDFTCAKKVADKARNNEKISIYTEVIVETVEGENLVNSITYKSTKTGEATTYTAENGNIIGVFVFAGYEPASKLAEGVVDINEQGYIMTDCTQKTSVDGIYAAGDVCLKNLRQVVTATRDGAVAATEMESYVSKIQENSKIYREKYKSKNQRNNSYNEKEDEIHFIDEDAVNQIKSVLDKMKNPLILRIKGKSDEYENVYIQLKKFMYEIANQTEKIEVEEYTDSENNDMENKVPNVKLYRRDGTYTGLAFYGVPAGHEFSSFVLGIYNASGDGWEFSDEEKNRIDKLNKNINIKIFVSLGCKMCPDLVIAAQKIASMKENITAEIYDVSYFPEYQKKYNIMSVPCMVINHGEPLFGRKTLDELLDVLEKIV